MFKRPTTLLLILLYGMSLAFVFEIRSAKAEPYLALRTGFKCSQCHVNRTGGGKRTEFGLTYSQTHLYMKLLGSKEEPVLFDSKLNRSISVGANFRAENISLLRYENVLTEEKNDFSNDSRIAEANLYLQFDVVQDALTIYLDQTMTPSNANREFFALIERLPLNSYLKVGRMLLPYGLRLRDDDAFIRNGTGYTYNSHDLGVEIGLEPGPYSLVVNLTHDKLSIVGSSVYRRFRIGGSVSKNIRGGNDSVYGAFFGANIGHFTFLGEVDLITQGDLDRLAAIAELNYLLTRGLNFKATYEFFDRRRDVPNNRDGQERVTLGVEPFITQFLQLGLFYRMNRFIPQNSQLNRDQILVQFHVFF